MPGSYAMPIKVMIFDNQFIYCQMKLECTDLN